VVISGGFCGVSWFDFVCSILGVNPNCSQEQIRKHYKKIAVLVHPDKNKQPGAEEAFKVLQRSFELIGEPVSARD
jgi:DnaJ family protein C protein 14